MEHREFIYQSEGTPERLDVFIARIAADLTRSGVQRLVESGLVTVNGLTERPSCKLKNGDLVEVKIPPPIPAVPIAEEIPLEILYEDEDIIVINKPAGMVVHPGAGNFSGTLVNALLAHCHDLSGIGGEIRPGIVHRIDKDTSGVLVVAKNDRAHQVLAQQFQQHSIKRIYTALVYGSPKNDKGSICSAIGRHPTDRKKMSGSARKGRHAATHWRVLSRFKGISLMKVSLETGRTHQIRVHLSEAGHPLVGDPVYGGTGRLAGIADPVLRKLIKELGRQALHAGVLGIIHPSTGQYLEFEATVPEDMIRILEYLERSRPDSGEA